MTEEQKEKKRVYNRAYRKAWREKNPALAKEELAKWKKRNKKAIFEYNKSYFKKPEVSERILIRKRAIYPKVKDKYNTNRRIQAAIPNVKEKHSKRSKAYYEKNRDVIIKKVKAYIQNPDKMAQKLVTNRVRILKVKYGLTPEEYDSLAASQKNCCKICKRHQSELKTGLHVDHDHKTGVVRGLLCHKCNLGIGLFNDNTNLLLEVINYLKENQTNDTESNTTQV